MLLIVISINDFKHSAKRSVLQVRLDVGTAQEEQLKGQIELFDLWMNEETVTLLRFLWKATAVTTTFFACAKRVLVEPRRIELLTS